MTELKSMVGYFDSEKILKVIMNPSDPNEVVVITLDENGEEVANLLNVNVLPVFTYKVVNNTGVKVSFQRISINECGVSFDSIEIEAGTTAEIPSNYATYDGTQYGVRLTATKEGGTAATITVSDAVNCLEYGGMLAILDPTANASCTATLT